MNLVKMVFLLAILKVLHNKYSQLISGMNDCPQIQSPIQVTFNDLALHKMSLHSDKSKFKLGL